MIYDVSKLDYILKRMTSRLLKMTWNDAVEVGVKKYTSDQIRNVSGNIW